MKIKITLFLGIIFSFILSSAGLSFCRGEPLQNPPAQEALAEPEPQWIWGDATSVDAVGKKIAVRYLDYESDTEKDINIEVNDKTTYENVKSIDEIKPQDTLSVDYAVTPDGKNIAKNISVERPESAQALPQDGPKE